MVDQEVNLPKARNLLPERQHPLPEKRHPRRFYKYLYPWLTGTSTFRKKRGQPSVKNDVNLPQERNLLPKEQHLLSINILAVGLQDC